MSRVYLDSMVWIYAFEANPLFGTQAQQVLDAVELRRHTLLTSHFLLAELLVAPVKKSDVFLTTSYRRALLARSGQVVSFTEHAADAFAHIRAVQRVSPADAIHLALAASAGADFFVSVDARLKKVTVPGGCQIVDLSHPLL